MSRKLIDDRHIFICHILKRACNLPLAVIPRRLLGIRRIIYLRFKQFLIINDPGNFAADDNQASHRNIFLRILLVKAGIDRRIFIFYFDMGRRIFISL